MPIILRFTGRPEHPPNFTVAALRKATESIPCTPEQRRVLNDIYSTREKEQQFEEGGSGIYIP